MAASIALSGKGEKKDTVEGNSSDGCRERQYAVGHYEILGYGIS